MSAVSRASFRPLCLAALAAALSATPPVALCQEEALPARREADRLYQKALDAYLAGNYDQAILHAARSVQENPAEPKAQDLLSVLVAEKESLERKEIWIGRPREPRPREAASVTVAADSLEEHRRIWEELRLLREEIARGAGGGTDPGRLRDLERRVTVAAGLLARNTTNQYEEMREAQLATLERLERVEEKVSRTGWSLGFLYALAGSGFLLALGAWRRNQPQPSEGEQTWMPRVPARKKEI